VPRLLLRALLLSVTLRMLGPGLLRLLRHAVRVLGHAVGRRLPFRGGRRRRAFGLQGFLWTGLLALIVLDVDDAALRIEGSGEALPLTALAPTSAPTSPVAPETPPSTSASAPATLAFRSLPDLAVSVQPGLRVTGVARLRRIG